MLFPNLHVAATLGVLLAASVVAGLIAESLRLPKVTAYLAVGILFGPAALHLVPQRQIELLDPLLKLAMGLVLFQLGCRFPFPRLKPILRRIIPIFVGEMGLTFLLVTVGVWLVTRNPSMGLLLGALALATAPATTLLVLQETRSEGPVTDLARGLVAVNNFASIVAFEVIFVAVRFLQGNLAAPLWMETLTVLRDIGGSLVLGALAGFAISMFCGLTKPSRWLVILIAADGLVLGLCESLQLPYMLGFLMMGVVVVNSSELSGQIQTELDRLTGVLVVTFFVIHGAELNLPAFWQSGLLGAVYIATRLVGKYLGIRTAAAWSNQSLDVRRWLGLAMLAQAGAAIALSSVAAQRNPALGLPIQTVILGTVVFFELLGPILIRQSVIRSGEAPVYQVIRRSSTTSLEQFGSVWSRVFRFARKRSESGAGQAEKLTVSQLMRPHLQPLLESATFDEVLSFVEQSRDNTYAVVNDDQVLVGVIRYRELSEVPFDRSLSRLVRAGDIAVGCRTVLHPDQPATDVVRSFQRTGDDCIPVVSSEMPATFLGMVRRRDITRLIAWKLGST